MLSILRAAVVVAGIAVFLAAPAVFAQAPVTVAVRDFSFQPRDIAVPPGTTVQWTNQDSAPHQVESDDGTVAGTVMEAGQAFSFTFTTTGRIAYHCGIHPSMTGVVVVQ